MELWFNTFIYFQWYKKVLREDWKNFREHETNKRQKFIRKAIPNTEILRIEKMLEEEQANIN